MSFVREFRADNHYVPSVYLKHFADTNGRLYVYRTLVPHDRVRKWKATSTGSVAFVRHLYTRRAATGDTDEIERWLDKEFEAPAAEAIERVIFNDTLKPNHWRSLVRFAAAQTVRTPAFFVRRLHAWQREIPALLNSVLAESVQKLRTSTGTELSRAEPQLHPFLDHLPFRLTSEPNPDEGNARLKLEAAAGRGFWQFAIRHVLTESIKALDQHRWTILHPDSGSSWFTTDDPVLTLNFYGNGTYDFEGGWGKLGSEILLPLGPKHLLYTQVGRKVPLRGARLDRFRTEHLRQMIAEHAYRYIFASAEDPEVEQLRTRAVDARRWREEKRYWETFHATQTELEATLRE